MNTFATYMALRLLADVPCDGKGRVLIWRVNDAGQPSRYGGNWKVSRASESTFSFASPIPTETMLDLRDQGYIDEAPDVAGGACRFLVRVSDKARARVLVDELTGPHK